MGEEANTGGYDDLDDEESVVEWVEGLPSDEDLAPLSHSLIPAELASAFGITLEPPRTVLDVHRASKRTVESLHLRIPHSSLSSTFKSFPSFGFGGRAAGAVDPTAVEGYELAGKDESGESSRKPRRVNGAEEADSAAVAGDADEDSSTGTTPRRQRMVWGPELHRRFVDVVAHLGFKNAVPKTIMQLMNVEGVTRENVASHLQKYRLYLKRMQGSSIEASSSADQLFAPIPVPQNPREASAPLPPYAPFPSLAPMPMVGLAHHVHGAPAAMVPLNEQHGGGPYRHPHAMF